MTEETFLDLPNAPDEIGVTLPPSSLRKIDYTALEFDSIRRALLEYVRTYFPDNFNDFSSDNGFIMLLELNAYLGSLLAFRSDILANEAFLPTAQTAAAVAQHLKLIGQQIKPQTPATTPVLCSITSKLISDIKIPAGTQFSLTSPDNDPVIYEIFKSPSDLTSDIVIPKGKFGIVAYGIEGKFSAPFVATSTGDPNITIDIFDRNALPSPVIVEVSDTNNAIVERWTKIDVIEKAGSNDKVFEVRHSEDTLSIVFGDNVAGSIPQSGRSIRITYRTGGGVRGRIVSGIINETKSIIPEPPLSAGVTVTFRNIRASDGGFNRESIEDAKKRAPLEASAHNGAVTGEDYTILSSSYSHPVFGSVLKAKPILRSSININQVELYILAAGANGEPVKPSLGLKEGLKNYLSDINVLTDEIVPLDGNIKSVDLKIDVVISQNADTATVRDLVNNAVDDFFNVDNFDIGQGLRLGNLYSDLEAVEGVKYIRIFNPSDDILEVNKETTVPGSLEVGYSELITLGTKDISFYSNRSNQRIES